jgi:hypothetical protein
MLRLDSEPGQELRGADDLCRIQQLFTQACSAQKAAEEEVWRVGAVVAALMQGRCEGGTGARCVRRTLAAAALPARSEGHSLARASKQQPGWVSCSSRLAVVGTLCPSAVQT